MLLEAVLDLAKPSQFQAALEAWKLTVYSQFHQVCI